MRAVLNVTYAYLVTRADAADAVALPAYQVAQVEPKDIAKMSRRTSLEEWLDAPAGPAAEHEAALVAFLTS